MDIKFLTNFNAAPPAETQAIAEVQKLLSIQLPNEYVEFLRQANGGEGSIGNQYVQFWRGEELVEKSRSYRVAEFVPEIFLFGSNGADEAFAFDIRSNPFKVIMIPFIFELEYAIVLGVNFDAFLNHLQNVDNLFDKNSSP